MEERHALGEPSTSRASERPASAPLTHDRVKKRALAADAEPLLSVQRQYRFGLERRCRMMLGLSMELSNKRAR